MNDNTPMPIREFSGLTGFTADTLRFYDRIGLLSPEVRKENGYRYYSTRQLNAAYIISNLRELGVGLDEIKRYIADSSLEKMLLLFSQQEERIQAEMEHLCEMREMMRLHAEILRSALKHGDNALFLEDRQPEPIFLCAPLPVNAEYEAGEQAAYLYAGEHGINLGFPSGVLVGRKEFAEGTAFPLSRFFFRVWRGDQDWTPAGRYAVAYGRCMLGQPVAIHRRLWEFIAEQGMRPCGDAYEEYPLDDHVLQGGRDYLVRVAIPVEPGRMAAP